MRFTVLKRDQVSNYFKKFKVKVNRVFQVDLDKNGLHSGIKPFLMIPSIPLRQLLRGKYMTGIARESAITKYSKYGSIIKQDKLGFKRQVHLFDPDDFQIVFRQDGKYPQRELLQSFKNYMLDSKHLRKNVGLLNANNEEWQELRSKVQQHISKPKTILSHLDELDSASVELCNEITELKDNNMEVPFFSDLLNKWAFESLTVFVLGSKLGCLKRNSNPEAEKLISNVNEMFDLLHKLENGHFQIWRWVKTPSYVRLHQVLHYITSIAQKYLTQVKDRMHNGETNENSFIENLLRQNTDDKIVLVAINDMLVAGIDSTSTTAAFFLYHMAKHQPYQEKLEEEIKYLIPTTDSPIPKDYLNRIPFLKSCLKESIRLNQASRSIQRILTKDTIIKEYLIPAGTQVVLETSATCRMEEHFQDSDAFRPLRWDRNKYKHPFAFLPFGFGSRSCVARKLSEQEIHTLIIRIFRKFRVEYHEEDIDCYTKFVNFPNKPLRFQFHER